MYLTSLKTYLKSEKLIFYTTYHFFGINFDFFKGKYLNGWAIFFKDFRLINIYQ